MSKFTQSKVSHWWLRLSLSPVAYWPFFAFTNHFSIPSSEVSELEKHYQPIQYYSILTHALYSQPSTTDTSCQWLYSHNSFRPDHVNNPYAASIASSVTDGCDISTPYLSKTDENYYFFSPTSVNYYSNDKLNECGETYKKCPITTCIYHDKGLSLKTNVARHTVTHYSGSLVCGFCIYPNSTSKKQAFNTVDTFATSQHCS